MGQDYIRVFKLICFCLVITLVGLWKGCEDISYMVSGQNTTAKVTKFTKIVTRGNRESNSKNVLFKFTDTNNEECKGFDAVPLEWQAPGNKEIDISYLPGKLRPGGSHTVARLSSSSSTSGILIFFAGLIGLSLVLGISYRNISQN